MFLSQLCFASAVCNRVKGINTRFAKNFFGIISRV